MKNVDKLTMKLSKVYPFFLGIGILIISYLFIQELNDNTKLQKTSKIRIGINEWAGYAPVVYAKEKGFFQKNNIDVELVLFPGQSESNEKFINEELDAVCTVSSDVVIMNSNGVDSKIVLFTDYSETGDVIIARPGIQNIKSLKNKIIGIDSLNSFSHLLVLQALKLNNLSEQDVEFKVVPYNEIGSAIKNRTIDAGHTWPPGKTMALKDGEKVIFSAGEIPGLISDTVTFNTKYIEKYPEIVKKFRKIFYQAQEEMLKSPQESALLVSNFFKNNPKEFYDTFRDIHFINSEENTKLFDSSYEKNAFKFLERYSNFYIERGQISDTNIYKRVLVKEGIN